MCHVADVVRRSRLRLFDYEKRKDCDDWVIEFRNFEVERVRDRDMGRITCDEFVMMDLIELGLHKEWASDRVGGEPWRGHIC